MEEKVILRTFPHTREEALAMLYLEKQAIGSATPEKLAEMYFDAVKRIEKKCTELNGATYSFN